MKRTWIWMAAALAAALWAGGPGESRAAAQATVDGAADAATDAADTPPATDAQAATQASATTSETAAQPAAAVSGSATTDAAAAAAPAASSEEADVEANASTDANATQPAETTSPATGSAAVDVTVEAGVNADPQIAAQQNLQAGLQFGDATDRGLAIRSLDRTNYFYNSGIRQGDVLVSYGGRPIRSHADFGRWVVWQPGQRIPVVVFRDGRQQTIYVTYRQGRGLQYQAGYAPQSQAYLGVSFDQRSPHVAIVTAVTPGSPAGQAGLRPGDMIVTLNGSRVSGSHDVTRTVQSMRPGERLDIAFSRRVDDQTQAVLGNRPGVAQASYGPSAQVDTSVVTPAVPAVPAPAADDATVYQGTTRTVIVPNTEVNANGRIARPGDADRDGRYWMAAGGLIDRARDRGTRRARR